MESKYRIVAESEIHDVLELATECVDLWAEFIEKLKAHNMSLNKDAAKSAAPVS
jgi:hypothetical protein